MGHTEPVAIPHGRSIMMESEERVLADVLARQRIRIRQRILREVAMSHIVAIHELEPMRCPAGVAVREYELYIRIVVEDLGRNERDNGIRHRRLQPW